MSFVSVFNYSDAKMDFAVDMWDFMDMALAFIYSFDPFLCLEIGAKTLFLIHFVCNKKSFTRSNDGTR